MSEKSPDRKWMTVDDTAEYLGVKKSTVYAYIHERKLPYYKRGHFVRFKADDIDAWIEESRVETLSEEIETHFQQKEDGNGKLDGT